MNVGDLKKYLEQFSDSIPVMVPGEFFNYADPEVVLLTIEVVDDGKGPPMYMDPTDSKTATRINVLVIQ